MLTYDKGISVWCLVLYWGRLATWLRVYQLISPENSGVMQLALLGGSAGCLCYPQQGAICVVKFCPQKRY